MDYKEKYNKLVEAIKVLQETNPSDEGIQNWVNDNVPELYESDERIRKEIKDVFCSLGEGKIPVSINFADIFDWLENKGRIKESVIFQHENKTCKENGDSLTSKDKRIRKEIRDFIIWATDRGCITREQLEKSNSWLAWLASPVLSNSSNIGKKEPNPCSDCVNHKGCINCENGSLKETQKTAECREKMMNTPSPLFSAKDYPLTPNECFKPAWSEEDETVLNNLIYALANDRIGNDRDEYISWLKSIKDRVQPQPKQEWSEEDIEMLNSAISFVEHSAFTTIGKGKNNVASWLKSLKDRLS